MYIQKSKDSTKMLAAPKDGKVCFYDSDNSKLPSFTANAPLTCYVSEQAFNIAVKKGRDTKVMVDEKDAYKSAMVNDNTTYKFIKGCIFKRYVLQKQSL